ncbi:MAG: hypothetical protein GY944_29565 [bacterium]|nr:hypothetical protein [bacterium]
MIGEVAYALEGSREIRLVRRVVCDLGAKSNQAWVQVAYEGQWEGHPAGNFEFNAQVFAEIIANYARRKDPVPLTFGHPDSTRASVDGAAGWIVELDARKDGEGRLALYALCDFTDKAASQIRAGEQRHVSVVVAFEATDEKTGEDVGAELFEVGLVLSAFIDGMEPLRLSRGSKMTHKLGIDVGSIKDALDLLGESPTEAEVMGVVEGALKTQEAIDGGEDGAPEAPSEEAEAAGVAAADPEAESVKAEEPPAEEEAPEEEVDPLTTAAQAVADAAGIPLEEFVAFMAANADAMAALVQGGGSATDPADVAAASRIATEGLRLQLSASAAREEELSAEVAKLTREATTSRIDAAIKAGTVLESSRAELVELAAKSGKLLDFALGHAATMPAVPTESVYCAEVPDAKATDADEYETAYVSKMLQAGFSPDRAKEIAADKAAERAAQ